MGLGNLDFIKKMLSKTISSLVSAETLRYTRYDLKFLDLSPQEVNVLNSDGEIKKLQVPRYGVLRVPEGYCARYARMAAFDLFGLNYTPGHAWDLAHVNYSVKHLHRDRLEDLARRNVLQQGMIIGMHNSESDYAEGLDCLGNKRKYTPIALYLGTEPETQRTLFADQFEENIEVYNSFKMYEDGLEPREIIAPRGYLASTRIRGRKIRRRGSPVLG